MDFAEEVIEEHLDPEMEVGEFIGTGSAGNADDSDSDLSSLDDYDFGEDESENEERKFRSSDDLKARQFKKLMKLFCPTFKINCNNDATTLEKK